MINKALQESVYDITIRMFILLFIIGWCLLIMYPFVSIILWSLILAIALHPLHSKLTRMIGDRPKISSVILVFSILVIIILPIGFMVVSLIGEVKELKIIYDSGNLSIPLPTEKVKEWPIIGERLFDFWQNASANIGQMILKYKDQLIEIGSRIGKGILGAAGGVIQIIISLLIAGLLLTIGGAGEAIRKFFRKVGGSRGDELADVTKNTIGNVVKGIFGVAIILAVIQGILLLLAGVPFAGIITLLIFVLAVLQVPLFIVTLPIIIYFFAVKETVPAIVWSVLLLLAGTSDNILRPILLGKGAPVPMPVIFIGVIGGFILSGFIGMFTGAIVMSIGYKLLVSWINPAEAEVDVAEHI